MNSLINNSLPYITDNLEPYKSLINSLAPLVNKPAFNAEFSHCTSKVSQDLRFLIKMEVKRLAKPCIRSIDLRTIVKDECRLFEHHGVTHYLNVNGILNFERLVKRYGHYTFGVYENVYEEAKVERQQLVKKASKTNGHAEIMVPDNKFIVPCQELLQFPIRKQERLNYVTPIEIFFSDNSSVHGTTVDISISGLRIKIKNPEMLHKLNAAEPINIVFRALPKNNPLSGISVRYQVVNITGQNTKAYIHLYRDGSFNSKMDNFVEDLIKLHKYKYKVNLDNVEMALSSKIYEQCFANINPSVPVFIQHLEEDLFVTKYASMNNNNKHILDYWQDEKGNQLIGFLVNPNRIYHLINSDLAQPQITVYCFNHVKDEKVYFYSASDYELSQHPELRDTFLSYGSRKASWRVYTLTLTDLLPSNAYCPSSLPDGINKKIDKLNAQLSPRLQKALSRITNMVSISDITNLSAQDCYQTRVLHRNKIKELKVFGHARNKYPLQVECYRHKETELRRQNRYILRTSAIVKSNTQYITGVTEDVSISGLKIELDEPFLQRLGSKVEVNLAKLQTVTEQFSLKNLQYKVVHINVDKLVIHLQAESETEINTAESFFSQLIHTNVDTLKPVTIKESINGISKALRNLHSKSSPQFCAYVEKDAQGYLPAMSTVNLAQNRSLEFLLHDKNMALVNLSWLYQDSIDGQNFVNQVLKALRVDPRPVKTEIFVAAPKQNQMAISIAKAKWQYEFVNHKAREQFIKDAQSSGEFFAFTITINKAVKPDLETIEQELLYLSQHAVHKATFFEERMWDIAGGIFLSDISEEVLRRYRLIEHD